jgi:hypothetical protein
MRLVADVNIMGGVRPDFPVSDVSVELDSVSTLVVRWGAKKFFVVTVDVGRAAFLVILYSS